MNKEIMNNMMNAAWRQHQSIGLEPLYSSSYIRNINRIKKDINKEKKLKIISWVASIFSLIGIILNAFKLIYCWPVWIIGNLLWVYWSFKKSEWSQFILWLVFEATNIFAWYQWAIV